MRLLEVVDSVGAAKGNRNGASAYIKPKFGEAMIKEYARLPRSLSAKAREVLVEGETFSDLVRSAIEAEVIKRTKQ